MQKRSLISSGELESLRDLACVVAGSVGALLAENVEEQFRVDTKESGDDYVTAIDKRAEVLAAELLSAARPNDALLGEEGLNVSGSSGVKWVIDPLDGTGNYILGAHPFVVSIAALVDEEVHVASVRDPLLNETYDAYRGGGARLNGRALRCTTDRTSAASIVATAFDRRGDPLTRDRQAMLVGRMLSSPTRIADLRRSGAAVYDLCSVAANRVGAYFYSGLKPWDFYAGVLIAAEAGAVVVDADGGQAAPHRPIIVSAPEIAIDLRRALVAEGFGADFPRD